MPVAHALARSAMAAVLLLSGCSPQIITEYSDEGSNDENGDSTDSATGDGDGDPGDGDGEPGDGDGEPGDGDGEPGDGDGEPCEPGSHGCTCDAGECAPGYECVAELCELSDYPWGNCGWNPEKERYSCGFEGESPYPELPLDCGELDLVAEAPCPEGLTLRGCCAYGGDAWWCEEEKVVRDVCGS